MEFWGKCVSAREILLLVPLPVAWPSLFFVYYY